MLDKGLSQPWQSLLIQGRSCRAHSLPAVVRHSTCCGVQIGVMFGNPETTSGGMALKYAALQRIDLRKKATIPAAKDKEQTGITVKAKASTGSHSLPREGSQAASVCVDVWGEEISSSLYISSQQPGSGIPGDSQA